MSQWQLINTAPRDGTQVLLYAEAWSMSWGEVLVGHFEGDGEGGGEWVTSEGVAPDNGPGALEEVNDGEAMGFDVEDIEDYGPTHWMHLPQAPSP